MNEIKRKPLPSEKEEEKHGIITVHGIDVKLPENPFPILEEIEPFYKSPYFIILLFQIIIFGVIIFSVLK